VNAKTSKTKADRFADFMAASAAHGLPIARATVRRYLAEHVVEITGDVVRFADGSEIQRALTGSLAEPTAEIQHTDGRPNDR
jgi:hypothetical protein